MRSIWIAKWIKNGGGYVSWKFFPFSFWAVRIKSFNCVPHSLASLRTRLLNACYSDITDARLEEIAAIPMLKFLLLSGTKLSDESVQSLAKLSQLSFLSIESTGISRLGRDELRDSLPKCKIIYDRSDYSQWPKDLEIEAATWN